MMLLCDVSIIRIRQDILVLNDLVFHKIFKKEIYLGDDEYGEKLTKRNLFHHN